VSVLKAYVQFPRANRGTLRPVPIRIETIAETESRPGETGVTLEEALAACPSPRTVCDRILKEA
jgi:Trm5-related predicted tRNA methylase